MATVSLQPRLTVLTALLLLISSIQPTTCFPSYFIPSIPILPHLPAAVDNRQFAPFHPCPILLPQDPTPDNVVSIPSFSPRPVTTTPTPTASLLTSLSISLSIPPPSPPASPARNLSPRVVGGTSLSSALLPFLAVLKFEVDGKIGICSATIVSATILITAAHCVMSTDSLVAFVGGTRGDKADGELRRVLSVQTHPFFNLENANSAPFDIAWVTLTEPVPSSSRFMLVNSNCSVPIIGSIIRNAGYGLHLPENEQSNPNFEVHQIDLPVTNESYCQRRWEGVNVQLDMAYQVCAGYFNGGCGSCNGDSGGPIFQYNLANEPVLVGVASIAVLCSTTNIPTVYVRTSAHLDFLPKEAFNLTMVTNAAILPDANRTSPFGYEPIEAFNDTGSGWTRTATLLVATLVSGTVLVAIGVGLFLWIVLRRRKRLRKPAIPAAVVAPPPVAYATRANVEAGAENVSEIRTAAGGAGSGSASLTKSQTMETIGNL